MGASSLNLTALGMTAKWFSIATVVTLGSATVLTGKPVLELLAVTWVTLGGLCICGMIYFTFRVVEAGQEIDACGAELDRSFPGDVDLRAGLRTRVETAGNDGRCNVVKMQVLGPVLTLLGFYFAISSVGESVKAGQPAAGSPELYGHLGLALMTSVAAMPASAQLRHYVSARYVAFVCKLQHAEDKVKTHHQLK